MHPIGHNVSPVSNQELWSHVSVPVVKGHKEGWEEKDAGRGKFLFLVGVQILYPEMMHGSGLRPQLICEEPMATNTNGDLHWSVGPAKDSRCRRGKEGGGAVGRRYRKILTWYAGGWCWSSC